MSAATQAVDTVEAQGAVLEIGVAASTTIYAGTLVAVNASGYAVPASASSELTILGRAEATVINTVAAGFGSAGALSVRIREGKFWLTCAGAGISSVGRMAYVVDDQTVALTDGSGARPAAGMIVAYDADASSHTYGKVCVQIGRPSLSDNPALPGSVLDLSVDGVVTANVADLAAFAVGTNTDGLTHVEGNVVALVAQSTAAQNGLYLVGAVASGTAALTRIGSLASGDTIAAGAVRFSVSGGTLFANTDWKNTAAGTVGTNDLAFYPARVVREAVLVAGTITISNIPILSATKSHIGITRKTANTTASTIQYVTNGAATPGALGTASVAVMAAVAAGTINNADISTLEVAIINF